MVAVGLTTIAPTQQAEAAPPGSAFDPGYIVSDSVFYDFGSMTVEEIQAFLDSKVSDCRATDPAIDCLKNIKVDIPETPATGPNDVGPCSAIPAMPQASAAQIIYSVANACGINPKVLIVTLQKEQGLVTSTKPTDYMYRAAMGFGCPDSDPAICGKVYVGLFNQVYRAAKQLQWYGDSAGSFTYWKPGRTVSMRYNPKSSCGSKTFQLKNQATAALYYYTPYTPNDAALSNLYGTGDSCSAYGNRNFWRFFHDWFGSPVSGGYLVRAEGNPTAYLITDKLRYEITDTRLLAAYEPMGPLGEVSAAYLESFVDSGAAPQLLSNTAGQVFLVSAGMKFEVQNCNDLSHFGLNCASAVALSDWQLNLLDDGGVLSRLVQDASGQRYWAENGTLRLVVDDLALRQVNASAIEPTTLVPEQIISMTAGAPLASDGLAFKLAGTEDYGVASGGQVYQVSGGLASDLSLDVWFEMLPDEIAVESVAAALSTETNFGLVKNQAGTSYLLTEAGRYELSNPALWGDIAVSWPDNLISKVPQLGTLGDSAVVAFNTSYVFFAHEGQRRTIVNKVAAADLSEMIGQGGTVLDIPRVSLTALSNVGHAMVPGALVSVSGSGKKYISDGIDSLIPIGSPGLMSELDPPKITLSQSAFSKLELRSRILGPKISCEGQDFMVAEGKLVAVSSSMIANFPGSSYSLQQATCFAIGVSDQTAGQFLEDSSGTIWAVQDGVRWSLTQEQYQALRGTGPEALPASRYYLAIIDSAGAAPEDFALSQGNMSVQPAEIELGFAVTELQAPGPAVVPTPTTPEVPSNSTAEDQEESQPQQEIVYVVKSGDTLNAIAAKHSITTAQLVELNNLTNPNQIYVGQRLIVQAASEAAPEPEPEPEPTPEPEPAPEIEPLTYTVKSGDSLSAIAARHSITLTQLIELNNLTNPNRIYVGQRLIVQAAPVSEPTPEPEPEPEIVTYTVKAGDSLWGIARKFGVSSSQITEANDIANANRIVVGQRLIIPTGAVASVESSPEPEPEPEPVVQTYTVKSGDSLWAIARKFDVSSQALADLNGINNANFIRVGQVLQIPS